MDRQSLLQSMVESALRAAAAPCVTQVRRSWDWFDPGTSSQPITPFIVCSITQDEPILIGGCLYQAVCAVGLVVVQTPGIRDMLDAIRGSVRGAMAALPGFSADGLTIDGVREVSCSEPTEVDPDGDAVFEQDLVFDIWYSAPAQIPAVIDPEIYLSARDPETGVLYTTTQTADPRRITRWSPSPSGTVASCACGAWADRASLQYTAPVTPLSSIIPPAAPAAEDTTNNNQQTTGTPSAGVSRADRIG